MLSERILKLPGFLYQIGNNYYYLGKWICKECTDQAATDCVTMYQMCRAGKEEPETNTYFQKLRAYSDFALEVPYNPSKIAADMKAILESLSDEQLHNLTEQIDHLETFDDHVVMHLLSGKKIKADAILWCNGRSGNTDGLGLENVGLKPNGQIGRAHV